MTREEREQQAREYQDAYVREIVDAAPPLTPAQRDLLRGILAPAVREWREKRVREADSSGDDR